jgi:hypothetical protein
MNPDQLKQVINFDYQLMTFAISMHQVFLPMSEKASKLSSELIEIAQKLGDFVADARKEGFSVTPTEVVV